MASTGNSNFQGNTQQYAVSKQAIKKATQVEVPKHKTKPPKTNRKVLLDLKYCT